jgi:hypothetical protein
MEKKIDYEKCFICGESILNFAGPTTCSKFGMAHLPCWDKKYGNFAKREFEAVQKIAEQMKQGHK